jgi:hypothetical protein
MYIYCINVSSFVLAVDLQLSIKVFGTDGWRISGQPLYKSFDLRTAVCGPYISGGSRNFEKGGPAPEKGGGTPQNSKNLTYLGSQILSFNNIC